MTDPLSDRRRGAIDADPAGATVTLPYLDAPRGEVVASDAALKTMRKTRLWAMLFAIGLFVYAVPGGVMGTIWLVVLFAKRRETGFPVVQFIVISFGNLLFAALALVGGLLALRYVAAAGRAYNARRSEALEGALVAQKYVWSWAGVTVVALYVFPLLVFFVARMMGVRM